jgi:hypothetical protein
MAKGMEYPHELCRHRHQRWFFSISKIWPALEDPGRARALTAPTSQSGLAESTETDSGRESRPRRWWPVLAPLIACAIGLILLWPVSRHQWALSLFRQPTYDTVLFFNNARALPKTAIDNAPMAVSFTIDNSEGRAVDYQYVLSITGGGHSRILMKSTRNVGVGGSWIVSNAIRPTCDTLHCRIEVSLTGHPETIDFLVTLKARKAPARGGTSAQ